MRVVFLIPLYLVCGFVDFSSTDATNALESSRGNELLIVLVLIVVSSVCIEFAEARLMECFDYRSNYWLVGFATHTVTVSFMEDCLRACLSTTLRGNATCRSAVYISADQECILADESHLTRPQLFTQNNDKTFIVSYYENKCSRSPKDGMSFLIIRSCSKI